MFLPLSLLSFWFSHYVRLYSLFFLLLRLDNLNLLVLYFTDSFFYHLRYAIRQLHCIFFLFQLFYFAIQEFFFITIYLFIDIIYLVTHCSHIFLYSFNTVSFGSLNISKITDLKSLSSMSNIWAHLAIVWQSFTKPPVNILLLSFILQVFKHSLVKRTGKVTSGCCNVKQLNWLFLTNIL